MKKIIFLTITQAEIDNNYLKISQHLEFFPSDSIGGSNKLSPAKKEISITFAGNDPVKTDIAGDKMIFRNRSWTAEFIRHYRLKAGDQIAIECQEPYRYFFYPKEK